MRVALHRSVASQEVLGHGDDDQLPSSEPRADDLIAISEERSLLMRALHQLDLDRRAVLVLHEWEEQPIPAVAETLEIPLNTAYSRLRLAREDLAAAVKRLAAREKART